MLQANTPNGRVRRETLNSSIQDCFDYMYVEHCRMDESFDTSVQQQPTNKNLSDQQKYHKKQLLDIINGVNTATAYQESVFTDREGAQNSNIQNFLPTDNETLQRISNQLTSGGSTSTSHSSSSIILAFEALANHRFVIYSYTFRNHSFISAYRRNLNCQSKRLSWQILNVIFGLCIIY